MITKQEYRERMEKLRTKVQEKGIDAYLVSAEESIYYLTGATYVPLERPFFIIVWPDRDPTLLVPALEEEHMRRAPYAGKVISYWDYPSPPGEGWQDRLHEIIEKASTIGVEPSLPREISDEIEEKNPETIPFIEELRLVKSPAEIGMLRRAGKYSDLGVGKILSAAYYGISELEVFSQGKAVQMQILKDIYYDALSTDVMCMSWVAPDSAQPHSIPTVYDRLKDGPHIIYSNMRVNGYTTECERTWFLSEPDDEVRRAFAVMTEARRRAFEMVRPGVECAEIDRTANGFLREEGYGDNLLHRTGHGLGLGSHEGPWISDGSADILKENMVISIEPGIYIQGTGGIRHSDTVLVTGDGYELLTNYPTDLESMIVKQRKTLKRLKGAIIRKAVRLDRYQPG